MPFPGYVLVFCGLFATFCSSLNLPGYALQANGRLFETEDGKRFFWQADTAWGLFHKFSLEDADRYLTDRASKKFNVILATALTQWGPKDKNRNGDLPLISQDPTRPNEPYWKHVDRIVEMAFQKRIRIAMVPAWGGTYFFSSSNKPGILNGTNVKEFGHWIGKRYPGLPKLLVADINPIWTNKSAVVDDYRNRRSKTHKMTDYSPVYDKLAEGLISGEVEAGIDQETTPAMITIHPTNQWFTPGPIAISSAFFDNRPWLTFDASQTGHTNYQPNPPMAWWNAEKPYEAIEAMYKNPKPRPLIDNEAHYENRYINGKNRDGKNTVWTAKDVRIGNMQSVFSGASGLTYGSDNVMQGYIPDVYKHDPSGPAVSVWSELSLAGAGQMQWIQKVITDRAAFYSRIPDQSVIIGDVGAGEEHITATRDSTGSFIMVYSPTGKPVTVETKSLSIGQVKASWYDPTNGTYSSFEYLTGGSSQRLFSPPKSTTHPDWVLILEVV
ncbi:hypothetical protein BT63DRAFT_460439 [Microthyrium microscopicum]|uniref:DUF4038 domain-containing protein n=1 Tax=Microthyrium microscopicum TaxID=703497 RepID=A0A6A6TVM3_9PEZI|nr:hypothetical protein BT63DRAFT_460439 [Microthyrium microscopicum]